MITMSRSKMYGALVFVVALHGGSSFMGPALRAGELSSPSVSASASTGGLRRTGRAKGAGLSSNLGAAAGFSRTSILGNQRGDVSMMAKKRRRRRVDQANPGKTAALPGVEQGAAKDEMDDEDEDADDGGGVVMPPMPSELGVGAVKAAQQKFQGEDMMSAAAFQPKPDVTDLEMAGGAGLSGRDLLDEPSTERKRSKYSGFDLDVELPMESESRQSGKSGLGAVMSPDGVMPLPDFTELAKRPSKKDRNKQGSEVDEASRVARGNMAAFTKLLELDPEADSEDALFTSESYDAFSSILGEGKPFVGIDNSYLQSGHTVLLALLLVCAFIELPGFPLTSLPYDVREFLKTGMLVVYVINAAIAYLSYLEAKRVGQPPGFWAFKGFVLGGLSFNELSQIETKRVKPVQGGRERRG
ncbi:unnamed protein product [Pylaiella littoralis]